MPRITACPRCGSAEFFVHESTVWGAVIDEHGRLAATCPDTAIDVITCAACPGEHLADEFAAIDFT